MAVDMILLLGVYALSLVLHLAFAAVVLALCARSLPLLSGGQLSLNDIASGNVGASLIVLALLGAIFLGVWPYFSTFVIYLGSILLSAGGTPGDLITTLFNSVISLVVALAAFKIAGVAYAFAFGHNAFAKVREGNLAVAVVLALVILTISLVLIQGFSGASLGVQELILSGQ